MCALVTYEIIRISALCVCVCCRSVVCMMTKITSEIKQLKFDLTLTETDWPTFGSLS